MIPLGILATTAGGGAAAGAYELISTAYPTTGSSSVSITSIPNTYKHLQLRITGGYPYTNQSELEVFMRFNSNTSSIYSWHKLVGDGNSVTSSAGTSLNAMYALILGPGDENAVTSSFGGTVIDILDYAVTTKNKTIRSFGGYHKDTSMKKVMLYSGLYGATDAISSISINGYFKTGSRIGLYGIKGA